MEIMMSLKMMKIETVLIFFLLSVNIYPASNSVKDMNKRLKNIDKEIEKKNIRIKAIDTETSKLEKMIKDLEDEIKKLEHERKEIEDEITVVKKNIDYSRKNLEISEVEHDRKESEFVAKIIAWDKYSKIHRKEINEKVILTKNYREILHGDLQRMSHIEKITGSIKEVKEKIEAEKRKVDKLEAELRENLKKSDIRDNFIEVTTVKTSDSLKIELNQYSRTILEKYKDYQDNKGRALPGITNKKMNEYLKELAELAGINEPSRETYYIGNERFDEVTPKYALIGTHAGRRTFICNALSLGIPPQVVMKWTGHSDYKAMKPYIDIADETKANAMSKFDLL